MPSDITLRLVGIWLAVGFFTGLGWSVAALIVARLFR
jgi:hypothetical protein